jgi:hypothetical protein
MENETLTLMMGLCFGYAIGAIATLISSSNWSKWEALGITYFDYEYRLLIYRKNINGKKQFKHISIQRHGSLNKEIIEKIEKL